MNPSQSDVQPRRIAFVSTRIHGTDGVSLEIGKWADVLARMGHTCLYITGESDRPADESDIIPEAHFKHPEIQGINRQCFERELRTPALTRQIKEMTSVIKDSTST